MIGLGPGRRGGSADENDAAGAVPKGRRFAVVSADATAGQWSAVWRRFRHNYVAVGAGIAFLLIVAACALAPVYARDIAHTTPDANNILERIKVGGVSRPVVSAGGFAHGVLTPSIPIGPTWLSGGGRYVLGADQNGRDVAVRLLYGGLVSLRIGILSAVIGVGIALVLSLLAAYYGGWVDFLVNRFYDLSFAFPTILLAIALGSALAINGINWGPIHISGTNLWITTGIIAYTTVPYVGRPLRGQLLLLRQKEFVESAIAIGAGPIRIMTYELARNVLGTVLVFITLSVGGNIVFESSLSYLGAGVQPPGSSWGTLIASGQNLIITRPWLTLAPGIAIVLTVLSLNLLADGLREAIDPQAHVRLGR